MISGGVHKYGSDIDTDAIIPSKYANLSDPKALGKHCLENLDPGFVSTVQPGDILMATTNFGCGSSREIAAWAIKGTGVACVVAASFARIFFRNAINIALPVLESPSAVSETEPGNILKIDLASGRIENVTLKKIFTSTQYPPFIQKIIDAGGLAAVIKMKLVSSESAGHKNRPNRQ